MNRLAPALRRAARELDLPSGARRELLLELAADLEAVFEHHRARGLSEADAAVKAEEAVLGSSEVIRRLAELHRSPWRGWSAEVGALATRGPGLVMLVAGVLPVVALTGAVSAWSLEGGSSPFIWPILAVAVLLLGLLVSEVARLAAGYPLYPRTPSAVALLAAVAAAFGLLAAAVGVHATALALAAGGDAVAIAGRIARDGAALLMGLVTAIVGLLGWFGLVSREARRADRELEVLLSDDVPLHLTLNPRRDSRAVLPLIRRRQG